VPDCEQEHPAIATRAKKEKAALTAGFVPGMVVARDAPPFGVPTRTFRIRRPPRPGEGGRRGGGGRGADLIVGHVGRERARWLGLTGRRHVLIVRLGTDRRPDEKGPHGP
jgi:hypothetical protein